MGKTSALLPLAAGVCGFHPEGWPLAPHHWRQCVYVVEDVPQALRVLHGYARHIGTTVEAIAERLHLVEAKRLEPAYLVQVGPIYRQQFTRTAEGVELLPLAVFDTRAACVASEDENNNSEASAAVAAFKQGFAGLPVWIVGHVSKAIRSAAEVAQMSSRGASAWGGDANCTGFIFADGEERDAPRFFELGKVRYEPRWRAVQLVSHVHETVALNEFGAWEPLSLRWAIAEPADKEAEREAAQAAREAARAEREAQEAAEAARRLRDEIREAIGTAWAQGNPLPRSNVAAVIARKRDSVRDGLLALEHAGEIGEVQVPARLRNNPNRKSFLVLLSPEEREAHARGELAEVVREIPRSWRKTEADEAPEEAGEQAPEEGQEVAVSVLPQDFGDATENEAKTA